MSLQFILFYSMPSNSSKITMTVTKTTTSYKLYLANDHSQITYENTTHYNEMPVRMLARIRIRIRIHIHSHSHSHNPNHSHITDHMHKYNDTSNNIGIDTDYDMNVNVNKNQTHTKNRNRKRNLDDKHGHEHKHTHTRKYSAESCKSKCHATRYSIELTEAVFSFR